MQEVHITYRGINLVVVGNFIRGQDKTYLDPGFSDVFDISYIYLKDIDISSLIEAIPDGLVEIENLAINSYYDICNDYKN